MDDEMYNKQIDEMSRAMCFGSEHCNVKSCVSVNCEETWSAKKLYNAGYRKQEWISVDERLPKHSQKVLVCDDRQNMVTAMYVTFDNGGFDWCTSVRLVYKVAHWMPLPEAPKMKGGE